LLLQNLFDFNAQDKSIERNADLINQEYAKFQRVYTPETIKWARKPLLLVVSQSAAVSRSKIQGVLRRGAFPALPLA
jgi:hypothetical protein